MNFDETFTAANPQASRNFHVSVDLVDSLTGYLLIQMRDVDFNAGHRIQINGKDLPSFDMPLQEGNNRWTTWMDRIPPGYLQKGSNRLTIRRSGNGASDNFTVANVAVHWREAG